jgi:hypothetical protein
VKRRVCLFLGTAAGLFVVLATGTPSQAGSSETGQRQREEQTLARLYDGQWAEVPSAAVSQLVSAGLACSQLIESFSKDKIDLITPRNSNVVSVPAEYHVKDGIIFVILRPPQERSDSLKAYRLGGDYKTLIPQEIYTKNGSQYRRGIDETPSWDEVKVQDDSRYIGVQCRVP